MDANASGWVAAYLEWVDADERAIAAPGPAEIPETETCSCEEIAAAYLEWMAGPSFGRRAGDRATRTTWAAADTEGLEAFREAMLMRALQTEADCLHLLRHAVDDDGNPPAIDLVVAALADADRLCEDERRAWSALGRSAFASARAADGRWLPGTWPQALENIAGDMRALAAKVLALQRH